ncbi:MAG: hypothetical protein A3H72_03670 [Candidatus Doudnabacteria bacterium RIFCSPLOWO2_02_FULL_48_8]|nr:MAG: hypothetical protein A3H72_03670 [Candidatus Doudnabacteria bacterium RIFCSPLOWO2_02_FULL_48_8]
MANLAFAQANPAGLPTGPSTGGVNPAQTPPTATSPDAVRQAMADKAKADATEKATKDKAAIDARLSIATAQAEADKAAVDSRLAVLNAQIDGQLSTNAPINVAGVNLTTTMTAAVPSESDPLFRSFLRGMAEEYGVNYNDLVKLLQSRKAGTSKQAVETLFAAREKSFSDRIEQRLAELATKAEVNTLGSRINGAATEAATAIAAADTASNDAAFALEGVGVITNALNRATVTERRPTPVLSIFGHSKAVERPLFEDPLVIDRVVARIAALRKTGVIK